MVTQGGVHKRHSPGDTQTCAAKACDYLSYHGSHIRWGSPENIGILDLKNSLDWLKKQVVKLQTILEAKKQHPNALEKEKLNMEHTKNNVNLQGVMKDGLELKTWKGGTGVHNWHLQDNKHKLEPHAVE